MISSPGYHGICKLCLPVVLSRGDRQNTGWASDGGYRVSRRGDDISGSWDGVTISVVGHYDEFDVSCKAGLFRPKVCI
jgi:hypothetical protein